MADPPNLNNSDASNATAAKAARETGGQPAPSPDQPVYSIRIAAQMVDSHPQTLRMYEREGLVSPRRTAGNARLYCRRDIDRIRRIQTYTAMGVNLAGIDVIFKLLRQIEALEGRVEQLRQHTDHEPRATEDELTEQLRARLREAGEREDG